MENYSIRNVAQREIYDSYMGILRISPINDDDDVTSYLETVDNNEIYLSDSDGNVLGSGTFGGFSFVPRVKEYENKEENEKYKILIQTKADEVYSTNELNVRSTLIIGKENDDSLVDARQSKLKFYFSADDVTSYNSNGVLLYPVESPNDEDYFNSKFKLGIVDKDTDNEVSFNFGDLPKTGEKRKEELEKNLKKLTAKQFENLFSDGKISSDEIVKIKDKNVYYQNDYSEAIPVLRTRDYVLGHCAGHSGILSTGTKEKFLKENSEYNTINLESKITKLSYLDIDKMVWDCLDDIMNGSVRSFDGRYKELGLKEEDSIIDELFGNENSSNASLTNGTNVELSNTAPFIIDEVEKGLIIYNAIPFRRYLFHFLRQCATNQNDLGKTVDTKNGKLTAFNRCSSNPMNNLTKNFLLCDGNEINYKNYPNINILNDSLFKRKTNSFKPQVGTDGEPIMKTISSGKIEGGIYGAIKASNGSFKTPELFKLKKENGVYSYSPRFLRGLTWDVKQTLSGNGAWSKGFNDNILNVETAINLLSGDNYPNSSGTSYPLTCYFKNLTTGVFYSKNEVENKQPSLDDAYFKGNNITLTDVKLYGKNFDFKINYKPHYHYSFYKGSGVVGINEASANIIYSGGGNNKRPVENYYTGDFLEDVMYQAHSFFSPSSLNFRAFKKIKDRYMNHRAIRICGKTIFTAKNKSKISGFYIPNGKSETYELSDLNDGNKISHKKIQKLIYKLNDVEGRYPISYYGGNAADLLHGVFYSQVKTSAGKSTSRIYDFYRRGMTYKIYGLKEKPTNFYCISSLPVESVSCLGNRELFDETTLINGYSIIKNDAYPSHYNLLPLIRI